MSRHLGAGTSSTRDSATTLLWSNKLCNSAPPPVTPAPIASPPPGSPAPAAKPPPQPEFVSPPPNAAEYLNADDVKPRYHNIDNLHGPAVAPGLATCQVATALHLQIADEPTTFAEDERHQPSHHAMLEEIVSIRSNKTWQLVQMPPGHRPIDETITMSETTTPSIEMQGPITRSRAQQLRRQVNSFLCLSANDLENRWLPTDLIVIRNQGVDHGGHVGYQEGAGNPIKHAQLGGDPSQFGVQAN
jgi:hypothetical protein